ncbi:MAG: hypothetical protein JWR40_1381 [Massilia sp.]|jgi:hypothetical protein|nr:hypothetical protein [Massilia sp.]MDB5952089.1 hypothetical protein [Massilia sp.]
MNVRNFITAAVVFVAAGSAFAANPADAGAASAPAGASAGAAVLASNLNLPTVTVNSAGASRSRADVRAEAVQFVKNYKTALSLQLDQYKN